MSADLLLAGFAALSALWPSSPCSPPPTSSTSATRAARARALRALRHLHVRVLRAPAPALGSLPGTQLWCEAPPPTHTHLAAVHTASAYDPGWSPQEMLSGMRTLEEAAEGLVAALSSNPDATGAP
jgi:hypothetical protein